MSSTRYVMTCAASILVLFYCFALNPQVKAATLSKLGLGSSGLSDPLSLVAKVDPQTFFVDASLPSPGDGSSERPFNMISQAMAVATSGMGDRVFVLPGTYTEVFTVPEGVLLRSEKGAFRTVISGAESTQPLVTLSNGSSLVGFRVFNSLPGTAVKIADGVSEIVSVANCIFANDFGVGILVGVGAHLRILNSTFHNNGVAIQASAGSAIGPFINSIISNNASGIAGTFSKGNATLDESYNNFWNNTVNIEGRTFTNEYNIEADPLFIDPSPAFLQPLNVHLQIDSPMRDAGNSDPKYNDVDDTQNDMGSDGGPLGVVDFSVPFASLEITTAAEAPVNSTFAFDASGSTDEWGIQKVVWDFDDRDGFSIDANEVMPTHTYSEVGRFIVTLRVTDHSGFSGVGRAEVTVTADGNFPPRAFAVAVPNVIVAGNFVEFRGSGSDAEVGELSYFWELEDGRSSTDQRATFFFDVDTPLGSVHARLIVTDESGAEAVARVFVTIAEEPELSSGLVDPAIDTVVTVLNPESTLNGASVTIPADATPDEIVISISPVEEAFLRLDQDIGDYVNIGPSGAVFTQPILIDLPHHPDTPHGRKLEVLWYDRDSRGWRNSGVSSVKHVDRDEVHSIVFLTSHLTTFSPKTLIPRIMVGTVLEEGTLEGIANATVALVGLGAEVTTNVDGVYIFPIDLEQGDYEVSAEALGYQSQSVVHFLSENSITPLVFTMAPGVSEGEGEGEGNGGTPGCGSGPQSDYKEKFGDISVLIVLFGMLSLRYRGSPEKCRRPLDTTQRHATQ